jgi:hypothetical protein
LNRASVPPFIDQEPTSLDCTSDVGLFEQQANAESAAYVTQPGPLGVGNLDLLHQPLGAFKKPTSKAAVHSPVQRGTKKGRVHQFE